MKRREFLNSFALLSLAHTTGLAGAGIIKKKRPNILLILADDMGYSDLECYGGDVHTPNLSALASGGIRFTRHYSTGRCWPSRACILTGFYAQQIRRDSLPGFRKGSRPSWAVLLPELLKPGGYHSYHSGKWHIDGTPKEGGFERSWGSHKKGCDWDRFFSSEIWTEDGRTAPVKPGEEYYSTIAIADHAIECLKLHKEKHSKDPFFQYIAFYSPHFPLHAMQKDIDRYRETYGKGWDIMRENRWKRMTKMGIINCALSKPDTKIKPKWNLKPKDLKELIGPGEVPFAVPWKDLTDKQKKFQAVKMAIHAAMISRMDMEIGRVVEQLKKMGEYENTLILFASDNGASAEQIIRGDKHDKTALPGSAKSYLCLGPGWATCANTPFRLHKHWNHEGGISSRLIVHWPKVIKGKGELRHEPGHFIDIAPTVMDAAKVDWPEKINGQEVPAKPGFSLKRAFTKDGTIKREYIWWAHSGNRAIRMNDWKLSACSKAYTNGKWELYDLKTDRCEMNNLASQHPEILEKLAKKWDETAETFSKILDVKKKKKRKREKR